MWLIAALPLQGTSYWQPMVNAYGAVWQASNYGSTPLSIRITGSSGQMLYAMYVQAHLFVRNVLESAVMAPKHIAIRCLSNDKLLVCAGTQSRLLRMAPTRQAYNLAVPPAQVYYLLLPSSLAVVHALMMSTFQQCTCMYCINVIGMTCGHNHSKLIHRGASLIKMLSVVSLRGIILCPLQHNPCVAG